LGGTTDPVTRMAQLHRSRPKAGRSKANTDAVQAVRDLQVLNEMLEQSDADIDIQAWKDVGAIHMFMQDMPGPDQDTRKRAQKDDDAVGALIGRSPSQQGTQVASDNLAVQRLLGQQPQNNLLQPPGVSSGSPLQRLLGQSPRQFADKAADTSIIHNLMSPHGRSGFTSNAVDTDIIQQLMSPKGSLPPTQRSIGGYGGASTAPLAPVSSLLGPSFAQNQGTQAGFNLMGGMTSASQAQSMRDADTLQALLR